MHSPYNPLCEEKSMSTAVLNLTSAIENEVLACREEIAKAEQALANAPQDPASDFHALTRRGDALLEAAAKLCALRSPPRLESYCQGGVHPGRCSGPLAKSGGQLRKVHLEPVSEHQRYGESWDVATAMAYAQLVRTANRYSR